MTAKAFEVDIPHPVKGAAPISSIEALAGRTITPIQRLEMMNDGEWEQFTCELVTYWKTQYSRVNRCGGAGDMGRDVIAYTPGSNWENYQCKYYDRPLNLGDVLLEVAKLLYYVFGEHFSMPDRYYFVAKKSVSGVVLNCLMDPARLKQKLISSWDSKCRTKITKKVSVDLSGSFRVFVESVDFSIFDQIPPLELISLHNNTPYHTSLFGSYDIRRPAVVGPPEAIQSNELVYIEQLLEAMKHIGGDELCIQSLENFPLLLKEFKSARINFYSAEGLEKFSRDSWPPNTYADLLDECHEAISSILLMVHENGWDKYLSSSSQMAVASFGANPLSHFMTTKDKKGTCHQLANLKKLKWVN
jgi:hypothetical protein